MGVLVAGIASCARGVNEMNELTKEQRQANAATHKTRYSDSSLYDEVCTVCGARDWSLGTDEIGDEPCPGPASNWRRIVEKYVPLIGQYFKCDRNGEVYHFFGLVHGGDDYYYGMWNIRTRELILSTCVGSLEGNGYRPAPPLTQEKSMNDSIPEDPLARSLYVAAELWLQHNPGAAIQAAADAIRAEIQRQKEIRHE